MTIAISRPQSNRNQVRKGVFAAFAAAAVAATSVVAFQTVTHSDNATASNPTPAVVAPSDVLPRGEFASDLDWIVANGWGPTAANPTSVVSGGLPTVAYTAGASGLSEPAPTVGVGHPLGWAIPEAVTTQARISGPR